MNTKNKLADMPIQHLLYSMAVPLMLSLLVQSLYNIVDSMFVAKLSETALTAASLVYSIQFLMIAVGDTVLSMISLIIGAILNIILDPIMIFGLFGCPAMGIRGAAIATVIGQIAGAIAALLFNRFKNPLIHVDFKIYHFDWQDIADIYRVGLPTITIFIMVYERL